VAPRKQTQTAAPPSWPVHVVGACEDVQQHLRSLLPEIELVFCDRLASVPDSARFLTISLQERIDRIFLDAHPHLEIIASRSTSLDHVDLEACEEQDVEVSNVRDYGENTVAEHTFALLLALTRKLRQCYDSVQHGRVRPEQLRGTDLFGKTIGILGCGRVGLHVIRLAGGFRMRVLAYDSNPQPFYTEVLDFQYASLEKILAESDVISLHLPLNPNTRHLINASTLAQCKRGVLLLNTARGGLIELGAIEEALQSGHVGGLGLDVLEDESVFHARASKILGQQILQRVRVSGEEGGSPASSRLEEIRGVIRHHQILQNPNVIFTPHIAYNSHEATRRICELTARHLRSALLSGESPKKLPSILPAVSR
jgi:D-lactate dehydrogenase